MQLTSAVPSALIGCLFIGAIATLIPATTCHQPAELHIPSPCVLNIKPMNHSLNSYSAAMATSSYTSNYVTG